MNKYGGTRKREKRKKKKERRGKKKKKKRKEKEKKKKKKNQWPQIIRIKIIRSDSWQQIEYKVMH